MSKSPFHEVSLMKPEDIDTLSQSAASAYQAYPLFEYFIGKNDYDDTARLIMSASIKSMGTKAMGITCGEHGEAFVVFARPNYSGTPALPFLRSGGLKLAARYSPALLLRLLHYENYAMKMKKRHTDRNCWYLYTLTVAPELQHKGMATRVLQPMLNFFDGTGQSCYLETHKASNVQLYEHYGFTLVETGKIPGTDIVHYAMLRKPRFNTSR